MSSSNYKLSKTSSSRAANSSAMATTTTNNISSINNANKSGKTLNGNGNVGTEGGGVPIIRSSMRIKNVFEDAGVAKASSPATPYSPNLGGKQFFIRQNHGGASSSAKSKENGDNSAMVRGSFRGNESGGLSSRTNAVQHDKNGHEQHEANYDNLIGAIYPPSSSNSMHSLNSLERSTPARMSLQSHPSQHYQIAQPQHLSPQHYPSTAYGHIQTGRSKVFDIDGKITWVEIVEPKSKTKMFANLSTGECRWDEPRHVAILRANNANLTQWWELYDPKTSRYYYYSPKDQKTIWQKPTSLDAIVVPLAKLQIMKQNAAAQGDSSFDGTAGSISSGHVTPSSPLSSPSHSSELLRLSAGGGARFSSRGEEARNRMTRMSDAQTQTPVDQQLTKPTMVSRWTQTTNLAQVNVKPLVEVNSGQQTQAVGGNSRLGQMVVPPGPGRAAPSSRPSLHHYLLSEARFAKGINQVGARAKQGDQLYDQVDDVGRPVEDYYDLVTEGGGNYYDVYEPGQENYLDVDDDEEVDYYDDMTDEEDCDADDEFGEEDDVDDEEDDEDEEEDDDYEEEDDEDEVVADDDDHNQMILTEANYENASDFIRSGPVKHSKVANVVATRYQHQQHKQGPDSQLMGNSTSPDGLRMSASFTAVDFKRNAIGRSSYTPSMHTQHQQYQMHQQQQQPYSNPFNSGSLRSSTGRIPQVSAALPSPGISMLTPTTSAAGIQHRQKAASNIADRIQLFNQKSSSGPGAAQQQQSSVSPVSLRNNNNNIALKPSLSSSPSQVDGSSIVCRESSSSRHSASSTSFVPETSPQPSGQAQRFSRDSTQFSQQQQGPSKSASFTVIAQQQQQRERELAAMTGGSSQASQSPSPRSDVYANQDVASRFGVSGLQRGSIQRRSNMMVTDHVDHQQPSMDNSPGNRNSIALGKYPLTNSTSHTPSMNDAHFPVNFDDAHMIMLNKSNSHKIMANTSREQQQHYGMGNMETDARDVLIPVSKTKPNGIKDKKSTNDKKKKKGSTGATGTKENGTGGSKKKKNEKGATGRTNAPMVMAAGAGGTTISMSGGGANSIESFARECVSRHRKGGIFSKKKTLKSMLVHTSKPLKKPMISTISDSLLVKEAVNCFKLIQIFMGDRAASPVGGESGEMTGQAHSPSITSSPPQQQPLSDEHLLFKLLNVCVQFAPLRDEVFVQVARQVTSNPLPASEARGLELMATLFWYFTASPKLASHLHAFLAGHRNPFTALVRRKFEQQLHRSKHTHSHLFFRKPHSPEEVARVYRCVRQQHVGVFGENLSDALVLDPNLHDRMDAAVSEKHLEIAWPIIMLTEALLEPRHEDREGVFRCVGDLDEVHKLKMKIDTTLMNDPDFLVKIGADRRNGGGRKLTDVHDIHVIACTLKLYFRELRESIIPAEMYLEALESAHSPAAACALLDRLPRVNRQALRYLIKFLQIFSTPEQVQCTKMDDANLSMVWAPNILRNTVMVTNNAHIYEHTRAEMSLVRTFIQHLGVEHHS